MAKVLIVDDAMIVRAIMEQCVQATGHQLAGSAEDGKSGLALFDQTHPDVVILDLGLPDQDGADVLKEMKQRNPQTRVVIYTAAPQQEVEEIVKEAAADAVLHKPITPDKLAQILKEVLAVPAG